jgi:hypothetical protein
LRGKRGPNGKCFLFFAFFDERQKGFNELGFRGHACNSTQKDEQGQKE